MYKLVNNPDTNEFIGVRISSNGNEIFIPANSDNTDYQAYLKWVAEGNTPLPADEVNQ